LHVTIRLFESQETLKQELARSLVKLMDQYGLKNKKIAYVKNERENLNSIIVALKSIMSCEVVSVWRKIFKAFLLGMHF
jgi:hypothetical protein